VNLVLTLPGVFFAYLAVFLAVIFGAWLFFGWQRRRSEHSGFPILSCDCCAAEIVVEEPSLRVRCPQCGAVQKRPPSSDSADPANSIL